MAVFSSLFHAILPSDDHPQMPDPWRVAFLRALSKPALGAVALTCKRALQLLLDEWPDATLSISVRASAGPPTEAALRRMHSAREQLAVRRGRPTTLLLRQRGYIAPGDAWWQIALPALAQAGSSAHISLTLQVFHIPPQLLATAGQAYLALFTLTILSVDISKDARIQLPPPASLPALRHLTFDSFSLFLYAGEQALWASVGPYLPQLVSLVVGDQGDRHGAAAELGIVRPAWSSIFSPQHTTHTLTHLTITCPLRPWLVSLCAEHAPALFSLGCAGVNPITDDRMLQGMPAHCSWGTLRFIRPRKQCAQDLTWLPTPEQGALVFESGPTVVDGLGPSLELQLPMTDAVADKLRQVELRGLDTVQVLAPQSTPATQVADLQAALQVVSQLPYCRGTELNLTEFTLTPTLATELMSVSAQGWCSLSLTDLTWPSDAAPSMPQLPPLHTLTLATDITDTVLAQVCQWVTAVDKFCVKGLSITAPLPEGAAVPWRVVRAERVHEMYGVNVTEWLAQTRLLGGQTRWELGGLYIALTAEQVRSGEAARMAEELSRVRLQSVEAVYVLCRVTWMHQRRVLRKSLRLASALPCTAKHVRLEDWTNLAPRIVSQLCHLPHWTGSIELRFQDYQYINTPAVWPMATAPALIPRSYSKWILSGLQITPQEWEAMLRAAPRDRTPAEPLVIATDKISPPTANSWWLNDFMDELETSGVYPNITWAVDD